MIEKMEPTNGIDDSKKEVGASEHIKKEKQPTKDSPSLDVLIAYNQEILEKLEAIRESSKARAHIRL